jgi:hypothetical protein
MGRQTTTGPAKAQFPSYGTLRPCSQVPVEIAVLVVTTIFRLKMATWMLWILVTTMPLVINQEVNAK